MLFHQLLLTICTEGDTLEALFRNTSLAPWIELVSLNHVNLIYLLFHLDLSLRIRTMFTEGRYKSFNWNMSEVKVYLETAMRIVIYYSILFSISDGKFILLETKEHNNKLSFNYKNVSDSARQTEFQGRKYTRYFIYF